MLNSVSLRTFLLSFPKGDEMWQALPSRPGPPSIRITGLEVSFARAGLCLAVSSPWFLPLTSAKSLSPQPRFGSRIPSHTSLPCDSPHFHMGLWWLRESRAVVASAAVVAPLLRQQNIDISQRITQMSLQLRAWKKDKNILKKAVYRHLENDKEMSKNQHECTRNKLCQTDLIFFLWQSE